MSNVNNWTLTQHFILQESTDPTQKLVLLSLANFVKSDWTTSVPISVLMTQTGYARNTIRRALERLEADGVIVTLKRGHASKSSVYRIIEPVGFSAPKRSREGSTEARRGSIEAVQRVSGEPLKEEVKDNKKRGAQNEAVDNSLTGIARRDAVQAARLITRSQKRN